MVIALLRGKIPLEVVPEISDIEIEQAVAIVIEGRGRATDQAGAAEPCRKRNVFEAATAQVSVEAVVVVGVGNQDILQAVVVEVGDDRLPRLGRGAVGTAMIQAGFDGRVDKSALAGIHEQRVPGAAHQQDIHVAIAIDVFGGHPPTGECRGGLHLLVPELAEPARRSVFEIDPDVARDIRKKELGSGGARGHRCRSDIATPFRCGLAFRMAPSTLGDPGGAGGEIGGAEHEVVVSLVRDLSRHAENEHPVLGDRLGDDLRRKGIE